MTARRSRAVSQVVAIALLVGIVTILAATMAVYVGTFGEAAAGEPVPNAVLETAFDDRTEANGQYLNVSHEGGSTIETANLRLDVNGGETVSGGTVELKSGVIAAQVGSDWTATETLSVNRTAFVDASGNDLTGGTHVSLEDATVRIVFERSSTETAVIYECAVGSPDCTNREA